MTDNQKPNIFVSCFVAVLVVSGIVGMIGNAWWAIDFMFNVCGRK